MLAVVQDQQQLFVTQVLDQRFLRRPGSAVLDLQDSDDRLGEQRGTLQLGQLDQPHPVSECPLLGSADPYRQPRLADAAEAGEGDDAGLGQQPRDLRDVALAPDEAAHLGRQPPRRRHIHHHLALFYRI